MPVPPYEPQPQLATQRVPGGRRAAFIVVVVAVVVVGTLIWKPWGSSAPAASSAPTQRPVAGATVRASPLESPSVQPTFPVDGLGSIVLSNDAGPLVQCDYQLVGKGRKAKQVLTTMTVAPPIVTLGNAARDVGLKRIVASLNLEMNRLATIFSAEWQPVEIVGGPAQSVPILDSDPVFEPLPVVIGFRSETDDEVFRVSVTFDWINADGDKLDTQYITANSYGTAGSTPNKYVADGCPATIAIPTY